MTTKDQIAHDLAMAYINNRYGADVKGEFSVTTWEKDVSGSGQVETERLPDVNQIRKVRVGTGERHLFGLREKTTWVASGFEVDIVFAKMIEDYYDARERFLALLESR
ncbi:hypothetical protein [Arthrobacter sp. MAHUQ-56]